MSWPSVVTRGIAYGIGVGPGDPELMTLKAVRLVRSCDVIAVPGEVPEDSVAYGIAVGVVADLGNKELVALPSPMVGSHASVVEAQAANARRIESYLDAGKDVACLTLGDPSLYSTFGYVRRVLVRDGYEVKTVAGVPSFCAAAACAGVSLAEWDEELHVVPATAHLRALPEEGSCILMKAGRHLPEIRPLFAKGGREVCAVERCGLEGERVWRDLDEIPETAGYLTTLIACPHRTDGASS